MLKIAHLRPFTSGNIRISVIHPHDHTKCIKILKDYASIERIREAEVAKRWMKRFNPLHFFDPNWREQLEYRRLVRMNNPRIWRHVVRHYGFIETDLGTGAVMELIRNSAGSPAPTLAEKIRLDGLPRQAVAEFRSFLREVNMQNWIDAHLLNVLFAPPPSPELEITFFGLKAP